MSESEDQSSALYDESSLYEEVPSDPSGGNDPTLYDDSAAAVTPSPAQQQQQQQQQQSNKSSTSPNHPTSQSVSPTSQQTSSSSGSSSGLFINTSSQNANNTSGAPADAFRRVYVENLPLPFSEQEVRDFYQSYGVIESCKINVDKHTGQQLGYCFVIFSTDEAAANAIAATNNSVFRTRQIRVSLAKPRHSGQQTQQANVQPTMPVAMGQQGMGMMNNMGMGMGMGMGGMNMGMGGMNVPQEAPQPPRPIENNNLYVAGIPTHWTQSDVESAFSRFGPIIDCKLLLNPAKESRGVAFVKYNTDAEAATCMNEMNGQVLDGGQLALQVRVAHDDKRAQRAGGGNNRNMNNNMRNGMGGGGMGMGGGMMRGGMGGGGMGMGGMGNMGNMGMGMGMNNNMMGMQGMNNMQGMGGMGMGMGGMNMGMGGMNNMGMGMGGANVGGGGGYGPMRNGRMNQRFDPMARGNSPASRTNNFPQQANNMQMMQQQQLQQMQQPQQQQQQGQGQFGMQGANLANAQPFINESGEYVLFVLFLPDNITEQDLLELFQLYGPVKHVNLPRDKSTGALRGYAFISMINLQDAKNAIQYLNGHPVGNKRLKVSFKSDKQQGAVGNAGGMNNMNSPMNMGMGMMGMGNGGMMQGGNPGMMMGGMNNNMGGPMMNQQGQQQQQGQNEYY